MKRTIGSKFVLAAIVAIASTIFMQQGIAQESEYQVYWGDVHGHTSHSDGKGSLEDYFVHARDVSKLDFVIVTDHDFGNGNPTWRMPKATWTLTQNKADKYTAPGKFVAIAGILMTKRKIYETDATDIQPGVHTSGG